MTRRLLVARLDNCGDVLLTGPAVRALAAQQDRPVVYLCGPRGRAAAELLPGVDRILEHRAPWIEPDTIPVRRTDSDRLVELVRRLGIDEAVVFGSSHQSPLPLAMLLRWAGVGRIGAVSQEHAGSLLDVRVPGDPDVHEVERTLKLLSALGYERPSDDRLRVENLHGGDRWATLAGGDYVVVHPGAPAPARTLAPAVWRAVVERLARDGRSVLVTGSRRERRLTAAVAGHRHRSDVVDVGGRTTFAALGRVLAGAAAFVGGNTGPMHLAAAVGTPTAAVFPPTVPLERWRPWRVPHVVLGDQGVACAGCGSESCPLPEQVCLAEVGPEQVAAAVDHLTTLSPVTGIDLTHPSDGASQTIVAPAPEPTAANR
jgi:ADP-heptose:LPS heptosyltransferase